MNDKFYLLVWTNEQIFFDKFLLQPAIQSLSYIDKFSLSTRRDQQVLQIVKFFLDKCTCSKTSMLAFKPLESTCEWKTSRVFL